MTRLAVQPCANRTAQIINPILSAVIDTFGTLLNCQASRGKVELLPPNPVLLKISALISISGKVKGNVCISFTQGTALRAVERFHADNPLEGQEGNYCEISPAIINTLGEIIQAIGDLAKKKLSIGLNIGPPCVVHNFTYEVDFPAESQPIRVHFNSDIGSFLVDFGFVARQINTYKYE